MAVDQAQIVATPWDPTRVRLLNAACHRSPLRRRRADTLRRPSKRRAGAHQSTASDSPCQSSALLWRPGFRRWDAVNRTWTSAPESTPRCVLRPPHSCGSRTKLPNRNLATRIQLRSHSKLGFRRFTYRFRRSVPISAPLR